MTQDTDDLQIGCWLGVKQSEKETELMVMGVRLPLGAEEKTTHQL